MKAVRLRAPLSFADGDRIIAAASAGDAARVVTLTKRSSDLLNLRKGSEFRSLLSRPGRRDHEDVGRWLSALAA